MEIENKKETLYNIPEKILLAKFHNLDKEDQEKVVAYAIDLSENKKYLGRE